MYGVWEDISIDIHWCWGNSCNVLHDQIIMVKKLSINFQMYKKKLFIEEDGSKVFLVDFQKKAIDNIREEREQQRKEEERLLEEDIISDVDVLPKDEGEEWSVEICLYKIKL